MVKRFEGRLLMKGYRYIALILVFILMFGGCSGKNSPDASDTDVPRITLSKDTSIEELLASMTLEEKVGQMVQGARDMLHPSVLKRFGLGSVLSGGGSYPGTNTPEDWINMITEYQDAALKTKSGIPIIYGIDAVHGLALVKDAVVFPHNIGLGAANDPELMYEMGAAVAEEMKLIRVPWNFSPCVAVNTDPRWGRTYECFSSDPVIVAELAKAYLQGQTDRGVLATAKHYVADGGAIFGTGEGDFLIDRGDAIITEDELRETHLMPYKELVDSGVKIIMASFSSWNGVKLHEHEYLLTEVLKKEYGFEGFVVSDWEAVLGLSGDSYKENIIKAVNAGIDMLMEPFSFEEACSVIIAAVEEGHIREDRINDAVRRILTVKKDIGLFQDPYMDNVSREVNELGSEKYRKLAKQLVEKSLVLLKNENNLLPFKKGQKIYVTGPMAHNIGLQCGGWGLTWQGQEDGSIQKVTEGTTILEGLIEYSKKYDYEIITDKSRAKEADIVLLAIGEKPYAEYMGDTEDMSITGSMADMNIDDIEMVEGLGKPVVTLIIAGRNVIISDYIDAWDSIVMCYLPGTEGDGVASVLSGEVKFTGKLPMPYYKSVDDIGKENAQLLFDLGYGLE
jgi:beta-glucosidase